MKPTILCLLSLWLTAAMYTFGHSSVNAGDKPYSRHFQRAAATSLLWPMYWGAVRKEDDQLVNAALRSIEAR